jgi:hypothetical protein
MLIKEFLEKYYNKLVKNGINKVVVAPKSMIIKNSEDEDGWVEWKPALSKVTKEDLNKLGEKYNIKISFQYEEYVLSKQFMDIQLDGYVLFGINENNTIEKQLELFPKNIISFGFMPIGQINDEDFIALNTNNGEVVSLAYDDYSVKKILFKDFDGFIEFLNDKI